MESNLNLQTFEYPEVTKLNLTFSTFDTIPELLEEAKLRGFYNGNTDANDLFSRWFFSGLEKVPEFKKGVPEAIAQKVMNYAWCLMNSFAPKHEAKEAVCAMLFDEFLEVPTKES